MLQDYLGYLTVQTSLREVLNTLVVYSLLISLQPKTSLIHGEAITTHTTPVHLFCGGIQNKQESKLATILLTCCLIRVYFKLGGDLCYQYGQITERNKHLTSFSEYVLLCVTACCHYYCVSSAPVNNQRMPQRRTINQKGFPTQSSFCPRGALGSHGLPGELGKQGRKGETGLAGYPGPPGMVVGTNYNIEHACHLKNQLLHCNNVTALLV